MTNSSAQAVPDTELPAIQLLDVEGWAERTAPSGYWFDEAAAARACAFFPRFLRHTKGKWAGQPFELDAWQLPIIRVVFGWKRPDGTRRFRIAYIEIPRKNGKTGLAAGIGLYLAIADGEIGAEVYSAANDKDQAAICHTEAKLMRAQNEALRGRSLVFKNSIVFPKTNSAYLVISSDAGTKDGLNAHGIIYDELHASKHRDLYDVLHTSTGARTQPLEWLITTAGSDRKSLCYEMHEYAEKVRDGIIIDPEFLPVIYAASKDDDWQKPETWAKANPNLGRTISFEYVQKQAERAKELPRYENTFKRLHLNLWTEQVTRWLPLQAWDACHAAVDREALRGRRCFAGLDLSTTTDITALGLIFPDDAGGYDWLPFFWVPEENAQRRQRRDRVPYLDWIAQGLIRATPGNVVDYDMIRADINALGAEFNIEELAIDRWNATQITTQLQGDGFNVFAFGQGYQSMSPPAKELEKLVLGRVVRHGANPVLRWMASNVAIVQDAAENIKPSKEKSTERIDGIVAGVMGLGRAIAQAGSIYEERGLITV